MHNFRYARNWNHAFDRLISLSYMYVPFLRNVLFCIYFFQILSDEDSNQRRSFAASYHIGFD